MQSLTFSAQPCSLNDFMDYLVYVEHNAENLQFYLWYKDYCSRFDALSEHEKSLSQPFNPSLAEVAEVSKGGETEFAMKEIYSERDDVKIAHSMGSPSFRSPASSNFSSVPSDSEVAAQAGLKWRPCWCSLVLLSYKIHC